MNIGEQEDKLFIKFLYENYFDFDKIVFVLPRLNKNEYDLIIKSLHKGLNINQIKTIFEKQNIITDIDNALNIINFNDKFKRTELEVQLFNHFNLLFLPNELNPYGINKTLIIIDDCTIINSVNPTQLFVYGRPLNLNTIYLSQ